MLRPRDVLTLAGITDAIEVWPEDSDLSSLVAIADKVLRVRTREGEQLVHLEFQSGHDGELAERLFWYNAALHHRHKLPVATVVVLLTSKADSPKITGTYQVKAPSGREVSTFNYDVTRLWKTPVETILVGPVGLLPLAPLCQGVENIEAIIARMEPRIHKEASRKEEAMLWLATYSLLGLQFDAETALKLIPKGREMEESTTYQAILEKGRQKGLQEGRQKEATRLLLTLGRKKLGAPNATVSARIDGIQDVEEIESLLRRVNDASTWEALFAGPTTAPRKPRKKKIDSSHQ